MEMIGAILGLFGLSVIAVSIILIGLFVGISIIKYCENEDKKVSI